MSDMPNPNTPNEKSTQEPSLNLEKMPEQNPEHNPNPEPAQSSDAPNPNTPDENPDQELNLNVEPPSKNTLATLCFIAALIGLIPLVPPFVNIVAIIMGHMARSEARENSDESGSGLALVGLILGYIGWLIGPIIMAVTFDAFARGNSALAIKVFFRALLFGSGSLIGR